MTDQFDLDVLRRRLAAAPDGDRIKPLSRQAILAKRGIDASGDAR